MVIQVQRRDAEGLEKFKSTFNYDLHDLRLRLFFFLWCMSSFYCSPLFMLSLLEFRIASFSRKIRVFKMRYFSRRVITYFNKIAAEKHDLKLKLQLKYHFV